MRCKTHCPPESTAALGLLLMVVPALVVLALAVAVLRAVAPFLLPAVAVLVVLAAAAVPVLRWARRFSVVYWPARQVPRAVAARAEVQRAAVAAPPRAIEAPTAATVTVLPSYERQAVR